jgi:hypothetical protein
VSPLLHAELLKLRTTRTFVALVGVTAFTSLLIVVLVCLLTEPTEESVLRDVYTADTTSLFILVLAVVGITGEWRHRTIAGALLAAPDRVRFLAAKTLAFAAAGIVLSVAVSVSVATVASVLLSVRDLPVPGCSASPGRSRATPRSRRCSARSASPWERWCASRSSRSSACS